MSQDPKPMTAQEEQEVADAIDQVAAEHRHKGGERNGYITQHYEALIMHKLDEIKDMLTCSKPAPEELENVSAKYGARMNGTTTFHLPYTEQFTYIDGLHDGPAFIVERKKS